MHSRCSISWAAALMILSCAGSFASAPETPITVIWTSGIAPFEEAMSGIRAGFNDAETMVAIDLKSPTAEFELEQAAQRSPRLIITIGIGALGEVKHHRFTSRVLATMLLHSDAAPVIASMPGQKIACVYLDVPIADVAARLHSAFPGKSRLGLIHNPSREGAADLPSPAQLRQSGFTVEVRDCSSPDLLLKTLLSLKRKTDFVVLRPDASLYNEATAKPLLLASLENQLPIVGFSASFVRAGAAIGIYPDYKDIGEQTAELAHKHLSTGSPLVNESPRKLTFAANHGVLRLFGLEYKSQPDSPIAVIK